MENINAQVESIDGNTATITSDLGEVKKKIAPYGLELGMASTVFSCLAAIAASIGVLLSRRKIPPKTPTPTPETSPPPSPPPTEENRKPQPFDKLYPSFFSQSFNFRIPNAQAFLSYF